MTSTFCLTLQERMYQDPKRWAYLFQNYVLLTMLEAHNTPQTRPMQVMERSVYSARYCFVENLRKWFVVSLSCESDIPSDPPLIDDMEYAVYQRWFDFLMASSRPHVDLIGWLLWLWVVSVCSVSPHVARGVLRAPQGAWST
jgi:thymidine kinase